MILVNNLSQLQQNNLGRLQDLYFQPIITPSDIDLQILLPKQVPNNYSFQAFLVSHEGDEIIADVTDDFAALFAVSIYNQNYVNFRLKHFSSAFDNTELFLFKFVIKNNEQHLFTKFTEPYRKLRSSKFCYAVIDDFAMMIINKAGYIKINSEVFQFGQGLQESGFELDYNEGNYYLYVDCEDQVQIGYCYQNEDVVIDVPLTATDFIEENGCVLPLLKLSATYNCQDNIKGAYYGDPKTTLNFDDNDETLRHQNSFYIHAELKLQPAEIKREVSFLGRPQRTEYIPKFNLNGLEVFPDWKMQEIESIFAARRIFVNGVEYIYRSGKIFSKDEIKGTESWILKVDLEDKPRINDFNCLDDCTTNCSFFVIPSGEKDQDYYDENKIKIGDTFQELLDYFLSKPDVISVTDLNIEDVPCDIVAALKIDAFGYVPSFIYYKLPVNEFRVFAKYDNCDKPEKLCDGISTSCAKPTNITSSLEPYSACAQKPSGITSITFDLSSFTLREPEQYFNNWTAEEMEIKQYPAFVEINAILSNPNVDDENQFDMDLFELPEECRPAIDKYFDYDNLTIIVKSNGIVSATGFTENELLEISITYNL